MFTNVVNRARWFCAIFGRKSLCSLELRAVTIERAGGRGFHVARRLRAVSPYMQRSWDNRPANWLFSARLHGAEIISAAGRSAEFSARREVKAFACGFAHSGSCQTRVPPARGRAGTIRPSPGPVPVGGIVWQLPTSLPEIPSAPPAPCRSRGTVWQLPPAIANPSSPPPALCRRAGTFGNYSHGPSSLPSRLPQHQERITMQQ